MPHTHPGHSFGQDPAAGLSPQKQSGSGWAEPCTPARPSSVAASWGPGLCWAAGSDPSALHTRHPIARSRCGTARGPSGARHRPNHELGSARMLPNDGLTNGHGLGSPRGYCRWCPAPRPGQESGPNATAHPGQGAPSPRCAPAGTARCAEGRIWHPRACGSLQGRLMSLGVSPTPNEEGKWENSEGEEGQVLTPRVSPGTHPWGAREPQAQRVITTALPADTGGPAPQYPTPGEIGVRDSAPQGGCSQGCSKARQAAGPRVTPKRL